MSELLRAQGLVKDFKVPKQVGWFGSDSVRALDHVDLSVAEGEALAVVGESGSGKTTLGRSLLWLDPVDEGSVTFAGQDLRAMAGRDLRRLRKDLQMVFQDPYASLDPRLPAREVVTETLVAHSKMGGDALESAARSLLLKVGLDPSMLDRNAHAFSGGQRQRLAIARAIATRPKLIVADEPVSALDLELQVQILELLKQLRREMNLTLVFITHDLKLVRGFCQRMIVMKDGRIVEQGSVDQVFRDPQHPYTRELLTAILPLPVMRRR